MQDDIVFVPNDHLMDKGESRVSPSLSFHSQFPGYTTALAITIANVPQCLVLPHPAPSALLLSQPIVFARDLLPDPR